MIVCLGNDLVVVWYLGCDMIVVYLGSDMIVVYLGSDMIVVLHLGSDAIAV